MEYRTVVYLYLIELQEVATKTQGLNYLPVFEDCEVLPI